MQILTNTTLNQINKNKNDLVFNYKYIGKYFIIIYNF